MNPKTLIPIFMIMLLPLLSTAQDVDPMTLEIPPFDTVDAKRNYFYEEVVKLDKDSIRKQRMYAAAKFAVVSVFNSGKDIIQLDDSANGNLIAKVYTILPDEGKTILVKDNVVYYSLVIKVKDGAYKYRIENMHKVFAIQSMNGMHYYDFELNNYNPNRHKAKKMKIETMKELNTAHTYLKKDINRLKKAIGNYLNIDSEQW